MNLRLTSVCAAGSMTVCALLLLSLVAEALASSVGIWAAGGGDSADPASPAPSSSPSLPSLSMTAYASVWATLRAIPVVVFYATVAVNALVAVAVLVLGGLLAASATTAAARLEWTAAAADLASYYRSIWFFVVSGGKLAECPYFQPKADDSGSEDPLRSEASLRQARVQVFSLALITKLWNEPHYRHSSFSKDARLNLRNVALPGTGIPLSVLCAHPMLVWCGILVVNPLACLIVALVTARSKGELATAGHTFRELLLAPQDWFSFWRLNCRVASLHAFVTDDEGYAMEDKQLFLDAADEAGVPVTPSLKCEGIVVKHRNEEGGMGFQAFSNSVHGGDWVIQEKIRNGPAISALLPLDAPLSTLRIVTASSLGLSKEARLAGDADINALSCTFRAGRAGAITDHRSILFDVDIDSGEVRRGTTTSHWYRLGLKKAIGTPWSASHTATHHPDCGKAIAGITLPNMAGIRELVCDAHRRLLPRVPLVGWDVALTAKHGTVLLEVNLSCNFFGARFDKPAYFDLIERYFLDLEDRFDAKRLARKMEAKTM